MLFETANQQGVFSLLVILGVLFGVLLDLSNIVNAIINPRKSYLFKEMLKLVATIVFGVVFIVTINLLDFIKVELWHAVPVFLGLYLEKISISEFITLIKNRIFATIKRRKEK